MIVQELDQLQIEVLIRRNSKMRKLHTPTVIRNIIILNPVMSTKYQIIGIVCAEDRPWTVEDLVRWLPDQIGYTNVETITGPGIGNIKKLLTDTGYVIIAGSFTWSPNEVIIAEDNWHNIEDNNWNYIKRR